MKLWSLDLLVGLIFHCVMFRADEVVGFVMSSFLMLGVSAGAELSGDLTEPYGRALKDITLRAQLGEGGEVREVVTGRRGDYSIELLEGVWTITAAPEELAELGLDQFEDVTVSVESGAPISLDLTLHPTLPLWTPTLVYTQDSDGKETFSVKGQAGTFVTIRSSVSLIGEWGSVYGTSIATSGFSYTRSGHVLPPSQFYRLEASAKPR